MLQMVSMLAAEALTAAHSADLLDRVALHVLTANVHPPEATYMNVMHVVKMHSSERPEAAWLSSCC